MDESAGRITVKVEPDFGSVVRALKDLAWEFTKISAVILDAAEGMEHRHG